MGRLAYIVGVALAFAGPGTAMAAKAVAAAQATIIESNVVRIDWTRATPSVRDGGNGITFAGAVASTIPALQVVPGRVLAIRREAAPLTAPTSFEIVSAGKDDGVVVRTTADREATVSRSHKIAGGSLQGAAAASIGVAQELATVSATDATVVVVVQYN